MQISAAGLSGLIIVTAVVVTTAVKRLSKCVLVVTQYNSLFMTPLSPTLIQHTHCAYMVSKTIT